MEDCDDRFQVYGCRPRIIFVDGLNIRGYRSILIRLNLESRCNSKENNVRMEELRTKSKPDRELDAFCIR